MQSSLYLQIIKPKLQWNFYLLISRNPDNLIEIRATRDDKEASTNHGSG